MGMCALEVISEEITTLFTSLEVFVSLIFSSSTMQIWYIDGLLLSRHSLTSRFPYRGLQD